MKKKKILQIGNFGGNKQLDGQTVKTQMVESLLEGSGFSVEKIDIFGFNLFDYLFLFIKMPFLMISSEQVFVGLGQRGMKISTPILIFYSKLLRKKINYYVVGGWLYDFIDSNLWILFFFRKFRTILVEIPSMVERASDYGLNNVYHLENFRTFDEQDVKTSLTDDNEIKLVFFSRVIPEKGIFLAIDVVNNLKERNVNVSLDIFGPVNDDVILGKIRMTNGCSYRGVLSPLDGSIYRSLSCYDLLLFPTYYDGEGFPGTIVDAFICGLPVIASNWKYNDQIIQHNVNGCLFTSKSLESLESVLYELCLNPKMIDDMKVEAYRVGNRYSLTNAIDSTSWIFS
ncbi:glycosyltransferase [Vibrio gigantis]|uniref:glycosyltransferase n=1 Tax=Vibrio gigantis TaxID=296199 RepID=UPI001EFA7772|nr:glycosyltransferase [Vibrio gigantis]ULN64471.1 glycosyltransferase [Vibrio gigantis]